MAAAMGAALLLPVPEALMLFAALGIGIALPFLAIAYVPALRRLLPKPGVWMVWFRKAMALPMGLTALALIWLCWRLGSWPLAGGSALLALLLIGVLIAIGRAESQGKVLPKSLLLACAALFVLGSFVLPMVSEQKPSESASILPTQPFSPAALAKARASGKPVFVYFTADWCLTCKVNEGAAIEREETRAAFAKAGVIVLVGDWTRRDPVITRFLSTQNAAGVPLYLWYAPHATAPEQLPQVLTPGLLAAKTGS
jgi:thiol:disulfide interchange protein